MTKDWPFPQTHTHTRYIISCIIVYISPFLLLGVGQIEPFWMGNKRVSRPAPFDTVLPHHLINSLARVVMMSPLYRSVSGDRKRLFVVYLLSKAIWTVSSRVWFKTRDSKCMRRIFFKNINEGNWSANCPELTIEFILMRARQGAACIRVTIKKVFDHYHVPHWASKVRPRW